MRTRSVFFSLLLILALGLASSSFAQLTFNYTTYSLPDQGQGTAVGDFNMDGWPDLAQGVGNGTIQILLNDHTGHFTAGSVVPINDGGVIIGASRIIAADIN